MHVYKKTHKRIFSGLKSDRGVFMVITASQIVGMHPRGAGEDGLTWGFTRKSLEILLLSAKRVTNVGDISDVWLI